MFAIVYGVLNENDKGELYIDGPFFYDCSKNHDNAEIQARKLAATKTKSQIIPWVFELNNNEKIPDAMVRIRKGWFSRFRERTLETHGTTKRDNDTSTCPFVDINVEQFLRRR